MEWQKIQTVQKAQIAEDFIADVLKQRKCVVYRTQGRHKVDFVVEHNGNWAFVDVKAKARRKYYADTGIDLADWATYWQIQEMTGIPVYIVFVDDYTKTCYYANLDVLKQEDIPGYPMIEEKRYIYFPLSKMQYLCSIPDYIVDALHAATNRKYTY